MDHNCKQGQYQYFKHVNLHILNYHKDLSDLNADFMTELIIEMKILEIKYTVYNR